MSRPTSTIAPRSWAALLLLVGMLALCALMMRAPHGAAAATAQAAHGTSGSISAGAGHQAMVDKGLIGTERAETVTETAMSLHPGTAAQHNQAHDQRGDGCFCCPTPLAIATACATVNTGPPQQHGTLLQALGEDAFVTPVAPSGSAAQRAAPPPSLAELSLLRV